MTGGDRDERTPGTGPIRRETPDGTVVTLLPRGAYDVAYVPERGVVGFAFESQHGVHAFAGDRLQPFQAYPHTLSWVPPGCDVRSASATGGEYLTVSVESESGADGSPFPTERFGERRDDVARRVAGALRAELLGGTCDPPTLAEGVEALVARVTLDDGSGGRERRIASWLTPRRLRQLDECIDEHLAERLDVERLASVCGVSASFLSRVMRAAVGRSPHRYLVERRLARARERLVGGREPVASVALACGFSSHAHLTETLRRAIGVTPTRLRRGTRAEATRPRVQRRRT